MGVARLGDLAATFMVAGAVFTGYQTGRSHELGGLPIAAHIPGFGNNRHRRYGPHSTQRLVPLDFLGVLGLFRILMNYGVIGLHLLLALLDGSDRFLQHGLGIAVLKADFANPGPMFQRPSVALLIVITLAGQEPRE